jgi:hypothetical protein
MRRPAPLERHILTAPNRPHPVGKIGALLTVHEAWAPCAQTRKFMSGKATRTSFCRMRLPSRSVMTAFLWRGCRSGAPGRLQDDATKVRTLESRISVSQHVVIDRPECTVWPMLHALIKRADNVPLERFSTRIRCNHGITLRVGES